MNLKPLNDFLLLEEEPAPPYHMYRQFTHIVVPDAFQHGPEDRQVWGTVLAKGAACKNARVKVGSRILLGKWSGARLKYADKPYLLVKEEDVLAVDESSQDRSVCGARTTASDG